MLDLKISIVIPVYNTERFIAGCLQSVMRQTYQGPIECIIVDDCGQDRSIKIVETLIAGYDGPIDFKVLHHDYNRGLSAARNTGLEEASGDYIYFLDSDDYISDDCLEVLANPLQEIDYDMVLGDVVLSTNLRNVVVLSKSTGPIIGINQIFFNFYVQPRLYIAAWNKLVKASLFKDYDMSFLEGQLNEDDLWRYKCCQCLNSLYVQKQVTYYFSVRNDSITFDYEKHPDKRLDSYYRTIDYVLLHPAKAGKSVWEQIIVYYMGIYSRLIIISNTDCKKEYIALRKRFVYHPLRHWFKEKTSLVDVKRQFDLLLPPALGYCYLLCFSWMRRIKCRNMQ